MKVGETIRCSDCGELITLDVYDLEEGIVHCPGCSNDQAIEEEDKEWYVN
uniref:Uncharacterized protein n=1 Tax=viral metagenome TaxID=1070528 RepID=A0A6M3L7J4_9ZZZZ